MPASIADDLLASPGAAALTAAGWRVMYAATHSAGVADLAAERRWSSGKLTARVRLVVHCDSSDRLLFPAIYGGGADALPFYSLAEDEPRQRRALTLLAGPELVEQLQAKAYPRDVALIRRAHIDPLPARARAAAISAAAIDDAFLAVEAIRGDLLAHDLDIARDDLELDRDAAAQTMFEAAARCDLLHPIVITRAEIWTVPDRKRHPWLRAERCAIAGHERAWIDVVNAEAFESYAQALTRHISAAFRKRRFAPADASSRS